MALKILSPIHRANRQIQMYFEGRIDENKVNRVEAHILTYLRSYGPCSVGQVVDVTGQKRSTITGILDRLEKRNLLARKLDPEDRRSFLVELVGSGNKLAEQVNEALIQFEEKILGQISTDDLEGFRKVMESISILTDSRQLPGKLP